MHVRPDGVSASACLLIGQEVEAPARDGVRDRERVLICQLGGHAAQVGALGLRRIAG
jgi:hypothetical protein